MERGRLLSKTITSWWRMPCWRPTLQRSRWSMVAFIIWLFLRAMTSGKIKKRDRLSFEA